MNRREVLRYAALMAGGAIAAPIASSLLIGCKPEPGSQPFAPKFFKANQFDFLKAICQTILPNGEVPGALEVGVPQIIDHMVATVYSDSDRDRYQRGFELLQKAMDAAEAESSFIQLTAEKQLSYLMRIEESIKQALPEIDAAPITVDQIYDENGNAIPLTAAQETLLLNESYRHIRQQTIAYFLSTEEICMNHLNYLPVPGKYEACISLASVGGKAWAI